MANRRLEQLVYMFSCITGKVPEESRNIILLTETGKSVQANNLTVMYEQETANLYSIGMELRKIDCYAQMAELFSVENIVTASKKWEKEKKENKEITTFVTPNRSDVKDKGKKRLLEERNRKLQVKRQNVKNIRSIEKC